MDTKQSSPQVSDTALQLSGDLPDLPQEVYDRFPETKTWMDEVRQRWSQNQQATQEFARSVMDVQEIGGVLFVDGAAGSLYIHPNRGAGSYADPDTPFYVDKDGRFSLKNLLTWDPEQRQLTVEGTIIAESGVIGGWIISPTTLSKNNAVLDSAGQLLLGTGNDVVIISATDATYRLWAGNATAGTATFSVTKTGALFSTAGTIGGFSIGADYLRDTGNSFGMASTVTGGNDVRFWAGDTFANRGTAPLRFYEDGSGVIAGFTIGATSLSAGSGGTSINLSNSAGTGLKVGDPTAAYGWFRRAVGGSVAVLCFNSSNILVAALGTDGTVSYGGLNLADAAGTFTIILAGNTGDISATTFTGSGANLTNLNASNIASNTVPTARLGSGSASSSTFLRGDSTWAGITAGNVSGLAASATSDTTNASNITSGILSNSRLSFSATGTSDVPINGFVSVGGVKFATVA